MSGTAANNAGGKADALASSNKAEPSPTQGSGSASWNPFSSMSVGTVTTAASAGSKVDASASSSNKAEPSPTRGSGSGSSSWNPFGMAAAAAPPPAAHPEGREATEPKDPFE
eukprot:1176693-Prorocentrum_minimum.AAC.3